MESDLELSAKIGCVVIESLDYYKEKQQNEHDEFLNKNQLLNEKIIEFNNDIQFLSNQNQLLLDELIEFKKKNSILKKNEINLNKHLDDARDFVNKITDEKIQYNIIKSRNKELQKENDDIKDQLSKIDQDKEFTEYQLIKTQKEFNNLSTRYDELEQQLFKLDEIQQQQKTNVDHDLYSMLVNSEDKNKFLNAQVSELQRVNKIFDNEINSYQSRIMILERELNFKNKLLNFNLSPNSNSNLKDSQLIDIPMPKIKNLTMEQVQEQRHKHSKQRALMFENDTKDIPTSVPISVPENNVPQILFHSRKVSGKKEIREIDLEDPITDSDDDSIHAERDHFFDNPSTATMFTSEESCGASKQLKRPRKRSLFQDNNTPISVFKKEMSTPRPLINNENFKDIHEIQQFSAVSATKFTELQPGFELESNTRYHDIGIEVNCYNEDIDERDINIKDVEIDDINLTNMNSINTSKDSIYLTRDTSYNLDSICNSTYGFDFDSDLDSDLDLHDEKDKIESCDSDSDSDSDSDTNVNSPDDSNYTTREIKRSIVESPIQSREIKNDNDNKNINDNNNNFIRTFEQIYNYIRPQQQMRPLRYKYL